MKLYDQNGDECQMTGLPHMFYDKVAVEDLVRVKDARIAELEKALRTVSIIDLGFGVPKWFCGGCASYGDGANSIQHKDDCIVVRTLSL